MSPNYFYITLHQKFWNDGTKCKTCFGCPWMVLCGPWKFFFFKNGVWFHFYLIFSVQPSLSRRSISVISIYLYWLGFVLYDYFYMGCHRWCCCDLEQLWQSSFEPSGSGEWSEYINFLFSGYRSFLQMSPILDN